jgi:hypothetical protein
VKGSGNEIRVGETVLFVNGVEEDVISSGDSDLEERALGNGEGTGEKTDYNLEDDEIVVLCDDLGAASSDEVGLFIHSFFTFEFLCSFLGQHKQRFGRKRRFG